MPKKILNVVEVAYRATLEEQDDPVLWISHVLKGSGADLGVLLRGAAVNYAVRGQDAAGLRFGERAQTQPPRLADDVAKLVKKGVPVRYVAEDAQERSLVAAEFIEGLVPVARGALPALFEDYQQIWTW
jgi:hypothetical protein